MWKYLEKLRALPESSRKIIVIFSSSVITAVLMVSWLVFPVPHFGSLSKAEQERKNAKDLVAPFSLIGGEIKNSVGDIKDTWASFGGTAGILSAVSTIKDNMSKEMATSTATSSDAIAPASPESSSEESVLSGQQAFLEENRVASGTPNETANATTTAQ